MLTNTMLQTARQCRGAVLLQLRRNFGASAVVTQKAASDPIQQLFLERVREYAQKSKTAGGKLVGATPEAEKNLQDQLDKIGRQYGATGADFTNFPTFNFSDPQLEPVGVTLEPKEAKAQVEGEEEAKAAADDKYYWEI